VNDTRYIVDAAELLADAIEKFAARMGDGRYDEAEQFASLAFYLLNHRVDERERR
jgi:hypothetical protein